MRPARAFAVLSLLAALAAPLLAQEPLAAGADGVPVPKKTKHVQPAYPAEALAQGIRGIVILEVVVGTNGRVESTSLVRSVPGLDEAAIAAARQWEYEPVKVDGKPVAVRLTVPITFALALPKIARDGGVPELRQGTTPAWPAGAPEGGGSAAAEVTLEPDGRVGGARVTNGAEPWAGALLAALRTWRFPPPDEDAVVSFTVSAQFVGGKPDQRRVELKASDLRKADLLAAAQPGAGAAPAAPVAAPPVAAPPVSAPPVSAPPVAARPVAAPPVAAPPVAAAPGAAAPVAAPPVAAPAAALPAPPALKAAPTPSVPPAAPGATTPPPAATKPSTPVLVATPSVDRAAAPPVEVITAPPPQAPPENGVSALRDVTLQPGVPDLARGRRPVAPPIARMSGTTGTVEVAFSVSAGGTTTIQNVVGPEALRRAAQEAVASWVFRRARADRAYLVALFTYAEDKTTAEIRPQPMPTSEPAPGAAPGASPVPAAPGPTAAPGAPAALPSGTGPAGAPGGVAPPPATPEPKP